MSTADLAILVISIIAVGGGLGYAKWSAYRFDTKYGIGKSSTPKSKD